MIIIIVMQRFTTTQTRDARALAYARTHARTHRLGVSRDKGLVIKEAGVSKILFIPMSCLGSFDATQRDHTGKQTHLINSHASVGILSKRSAGRLMPIHGREQQLNKPCATHVFQTICWYPPSSLLPLNLCWSLSVTTFAPTKTFS